MRLVRKNEYERVLAERERVIQIQAEQVEWLRAQISKIPSGHGIAAATPMPMFDMNSETLPDGITMQSAGAMSDDEEQLEAMRQAGVLSPAEYAEALENLKRRDASQIIE